MKAVRFTQEVVTEMNANYFKMGFLKSNSPEGWAWIKRFCVMT